MSVISGLFNVLALLYIGRALQLVVQIARNWAELRQEPLTRAKQQQAEQAAFFVGVPPAVLVHELAHAAAIWLFGGQVVEFGYRVFWGYVVPQGTFSLTQNWIIAVAGTLGSLAFGAALWLLLRRNPSRTLQYFGLRAFRFQIYFSLLYYPIFSLFLPIGDWRTIYDFAATPLLSGGTAVIHAALLLWFWRADRAGAFEMPAFDTAAEQAHYEATAAVTGDPAAQLRAVQTLRQGGAPHRANRALAAFIATYPQLAEGQLQRALLGAQGRGGVGHGVGRDAAEAARRALVLGLREPGDAALAHQLIALHELERGDGRAAQAELDAALSAAPGYDPDWLPGLRRAELHALRGQAYRRQARYEDAYREIGLGIDLAVAAGREDVARRLRDEQQLVEKHAGRVLSAPAEQTSAHLPR
ncbi:MAG: M50 family metallopeptidase [Candidatus Promineofilum sp.]|nr:M50 family metallopeptidase [Promineifilum sp.]